MTAPNPSADQASRRSPVVWLALLAVVIVAGIMAVVVAGDSGDSDDSKRVEVASPVTEGATTTTVGPVGTVTSAPDSAPVLAPYNADDEDVAVGETIPTVEGTQMGSADPIVIGPDGGAQVIVFVAHWCPHCQREIPRLVAHLAENPLPDGVELVTVSTAVVEARGNYPPQRWLDDEGWTAPVLVDDADQTVANAFGLTSFPYFVAVDPQGEVVARASGELTNEQFDALVEAAQGR